MYPKSLIFDEIGDYIRVLSVGFLLIWDFGEYSRFLLGSIVLVLVRWN